MAWPWESRLAGRRGTIVDVYQISRKEKCLRNVYIGQCSRWSWLTTIIMTISPVTVRK